jgi:succinate dehydrogenase/fumarate reductase flavoprotein subunit
MLTVVSDTHSTDSHRLTGRTLQAVRDADVVAHAGDFMRESVLDDFEREASRFLGVTGNNDDEEIRGSLPEARSFTFGGLKCNSSAQVLDLDGEPIAGLYAAGETMGLYYGRYTGATSVLRGAVFGRIAGMDAAERAGRSDSGGMRASTPAG